MPDPDPLLVKSLGRISGGMLSDNLLRNGSDLAFDNDLLYLKVSPQTAGSPVSPSGPGTNLNDDGDPNWPNGSAGSGIGVNEENPVYDLDINGTTNFLTSRVVNRATIDNVIIDGSGFISSTTGPINVTPTGSNPTLFHEKLITANLEINDNYISSFSNANIVFDPAGSGFLNLLATTNITGNLGVSGDIQLDGNLSKQGNIIIGNDIFVADGVADDTITINTDFTQSLIPGTTNTYDLGRANRRWSEIHAPDISNIDNQIINSAIIGNQLRIDGLSNTIFATQSNDDVFLSPDTGITFIEDLQFQDNTITNLLNTPSGFIENGSGYLKFGGSNGIVVPSGTTSERPVNPEIGDTRWNTTRQLLECFDGSVYVVSTGGGETVTQNLMEELGHIYTLMWG